MYIKTVINQKQKVPCVSNYPYINIHIVVRSMHIMGHSMNGDLERFQSQVKLGLSGNGR